ncbi:2'-5' RNA ligase family protein [Kutzneria kofuensis]|uniref:2'-5' RNA ligase n=1 Tax=Kutzneria kofuensis TaxID=103725 RepID=A0A7W9KGZ9_9PSEU|nr:2'-5' RNA ligase family protein [Kutzneria kofuensis]MBB5892272.1 2'-5' RNA ligase [Kutzneria kofuensis]
MAQALEFFFDGEADTAVRALWQRLERAGVPSLATRSHRRHRPHVTFALGGAFTRQTRADLAAELSLLALPSIWLYTLGTFPTTDTHLVLTAVVDAELLAVHSAVHDVLAKKVRNPVAYYLPGSWVPHCTLAQEIDTATLAAGIAALHPAEPIRAEVDEVGITDTVTGEVDVLFSR